VNLKILYKDIVKDNIKLEKKNEFLGDALVIVTVIAIAFGGIVILT
jgi:hypothetical protein